MENRAHALVAGIFVIVLGIASGYAVRWFSNQDILRDRYLLVSEAGSVSGLNPAAVVRYRGVSIGKVEEIRFDSQDQTFILVGITVNSDIKLPTNIYAQLANQGLTGLAYIELNTEGDPEETFLPADSRIELRASFIRKLSDSVENILNNTNKAVKRLNALMNEKNQEQFSAILANLAHAIQRYGSLVEQLQPGLKSLPDLSVEANRVMKQTHQLLSEVHQTVIKTNQPGGLTDGLAQSAQAFADSMPKLREATESITHSTHHINRLLQKLEENPQSLLLGSPAVPPGPGEMGFNPPQNRLP